MKKRNELKKLFKQVKAYSDPDLEEIKFSLTSKTKNEDALTSL